MEGCVTIYIGGHQQGMCRGGDDEECDDGMVRKNRELEV
jgi:hypothetical protein